MREFYARDGYSEVITPLIWDTELFKISGHYDNYHENMFFSEVDERRVRRQADELPRPHARSSRMQRRSYRDLPIRYADFAPPAPLRAHRRDRTAWCACARSRRTTRTSSALEEQIEAEIDRELRLIKEIYDTFGFEEVRIALSTRPEKRIGADELWDARRERRWRTALKKNGLDVPASIPGDGAFYGPKLDFQVTDAIGRRGSSAPSSSTTRCRSASSSSYIGADNARAPAGDDPPRDPRLDRAVHRHPHRALRRRLPALAGAGAGRRCCRCRRSSSTTAARRRAKLSAAGLRVETDESNEKLGAKIRDAQLQKVPYMLVVGEKEAAAGTVSVRKRTGRRAGDRCPIEEFVAEARRLIAGALVDFVEVYS